MLEIAEPFRRNERDDADDSVAYGEDTPQHADRLGITNVIGRVHVRGLDVLDFGTHPGGSSQRVTTTSRSTQQQQTRCHDRGRLSKNARSSTRNHSTVNSRESSVQRNAIERKIADRIAKKKEENPTPSFLRADPNGSITPGRRSLILEYYYIHHRPIVVRQQWNHRVYKTHESRGSHSCGGETSLAREQREPCILSLLQRYPTISRD